MSAAPDSVLNPPLDSRADARNLVAVALSLTVLSVAGGASSQNASAPQADVGLVDIGHGIELRRMVVRHPSPKGVVLFLHGFPETLYAWKDVSLALGRDYEVYAFDWPGYGLSTRPPADVFSYAPMDYAKVLKDYISASGINTSKLVVYATDIGALPALLLALDEPDIARRIVVGDFAPFDRPQYMYSSLQALKTKSSSEATRAHMNKTRDEILENAYRRGLSKDEQFDISQELKDDMLKGWDQPSMSTADAFYHYYSHFTRDQLYFESNLARLKTPVKVVWGEKDLYISTEMGVEFSQRTQSALGILRGIGHYPHLQSPQHVVEEVRGSFGPR